MFLYYSSKSAAPMGSEYMLNMGLSDWLSFCADAGIVDNSKRGCTNSDMQNVFVAVNFEEESETAEADANDDDAMMRCVAVDGRGLWRELWNGQTESGGRLGRARHRNCAPKQPREARCSLTCAFLPACPCVCQV